MPDFVRVVNKEDTPFKYHHLNNKKAIKPLGETMMPWDLACSLFGDPFAIDAPKKPDRKQALDRARGNFNFELGMETMAAFESRRPKLECYDMETQQRIFMLIEDPDGEHMADFVPPDGESTDQIGLLQRQVAALTDQLGILINQRVQNTPESPMGQTVTASTDGPAPDMVPSGKAAEFVDGNAFAQRPDDELTAPLFDFGALSTLGPDDVPPNFAPGEAPVIAPAGEPSTDEPQDAGVGSGHDDAPGTGRTARSRLAPKP